MNMWTEIVDHIKKQLDDKPNVYFSVFYVLLLYCISIFLDSSKVYETLKTAIAGFGGLIVFVTASLFLVKIIALVYKQYIQQYTHKHVKVFEVAARIEPNKLFIRLLVDVIPMFSLLAIAARWGDNNIVCFCTLFLSLIFIRLVLLKENAKLVLNILRLVLVVFTFICESSGLLLPDKLGVISTVVIGSMSFDAIASEIGTRRSGKKNDIDSDG